MDIHIAGPGCRNCEALAARVKACLEKHSIEATLVKVTDYKEIAALGILMTPGLVVNGKLLSQGKLPTDSTLEAWLLREAGR